MKNRKSFITLILSLTTVIAFGQQKDPVLMKVGNKEVTRDEFKAIFTKNLKDSVISQQALDEYLVLFTKFKLKVTEAESMGLDTTKKFREELVGYRKQLARPYLTDNAMSDELVKEAYERMKEELRASHILAKCDMDAMPKDTLAAYKKALAWRERILKGEAFEKVATAKDGSDDPSAAKNGGDIGYFSALQMVYPFETACYKMKVGEISMPVRTKFGYHIIKLVDRRPARGQVHVSHILISSREEDDPKSKEAASAKANEIYGKAKAGEDFAGLARQYSDDGSSSKKGGELATFGPGKMVPEFEEASFALQNPGDISPVIKTTYGYHIIKLHEKIPVQSFEEMKGQLKQKISRDSRAVLPKKAFLDKLKKKYKFKESRSTMDLFEKNVDTSIFYGRWRKEYLYAASTYVRPTIKPTEDGLIKENKKEEKGEKVPVKENIPVDKKKEAAMKKKIMFSFAGKKYSQYDFAVYLEKNQRKDKELEMNKYLKQSFNTWIYDEMIAYEDSKLEGQYPEFKMLMKEYRDGILLFELTDQKVWNKAVKDTAGLRNYYTLHKSRYMWPVRYDVEIFTCASEEIAKKVKLDVETPGIVASSDALREKYNKDSQLNLKIEGGKYAKEDKEVFNMINLKPGVSDIIKKDNQFVIVKIKEVIPPVAKTLNEAKGVITADYQGHLEAEWIKELEAKYKVEVNKDVLYSIKKK